MCSHGHPPEREQEQTEIRDSEQLYQPGFLMKIPTALVLGLVRLYQILISPLLGNVCRFEPSCSRYFVGAVRKYGLIRGGWKGVVRISRCQPWNPGGYDPP